MSEILKFANSLSPLSDEAATEFLQCIHTTTYNKGEIIHSEGKICKHLFFIESD